MRLCPDEAMAHLGIDLFDEQIRARLEEWFWRLAQDLLRLGTSVILEFGFWLRSERDEMRRVAHDLGARVELHYLDVPIDERHRRVEDRVTEESWPAPVISFGQLEEWTGLFQVPPAAELALFDHSVVIRPGEGSP